ncbi:ArsR family transcriptional regulator [bacterium]|nr:ArsR family transcriptional regulator [bacterium]
MQILSIADLKKIINKRKTTFVYKNPYFLNGELKFLEGDNTIIIDFLVFYKFNIDIDHLKLNGDTVIINSYGDIKNFINFFEKDKFNYLLDKLAKNFNHIVFFILQKEVKFFSVNEIYIIDIKDENSIISPIKKQYPHMILPFLSKIANGQISVFSILSLLAEMPYLKLSQIAKQLGKKPPVIKVYLNRMMEANLIAARDKTYFIPSQFFSHYLSNKKVKVRMEIESQKEEVKNVEKNNDFDYLN